VELLGESKMSRKQQPLQKEAVEAIILVKSVDIGDTYRKKLPWSPFKIVFFILFEFAVMLYMGYNFIFLIPIHVKQMVQIGDKTIFMAILSCSSSLASVISGIVAGYFSDRINTRFGRRVPFILPSVVIMVVTLMIRTVMPIKNTSKDIIALYTLLYVIGSCGKEAAITAYKSLIPDLVHPSQIGLVSGLFGFSALSALIFGLGLFGVLVSYISEIVISSIVCIVLILTCLIAILLFQEPKCHYSSGLIEFSRTNSENVLIVKNAYIQSNDNTATEKDYLLSHMKDIEIKETITSFSYKELLTNTIFVNNNSYIRK
jgi:MFS family permease